MVNWHSYLVEGVFWRNGRVESIIEKVFLGLNTTTLTPPFNPFSTLSNPTKLYPVDSKKRSRNPAKNRKKIETVERRLLF